MGTTGNNNSLEELVKPCSQYGMPSGKKHPRGWDLNPKAKPLLEYLNYSRRKNGQRVEDREPFTLEQAILQISDETGELYETLLDYYHKRPWLFGNALAKLWKKAGELEEILFLVDSDKAWRGTPKEQLKIQENAATAYHLLEAELKSLLAEDLESINPERVEKALRGVGSIMSGALHHADVRDCLLAQSRLYPLADKVIDTCGCDSDLTFAWYSIGKNHVGNGLGSSLWCQRSWTRGFPTPALTRDERDGIIKPLIKASEFARCAQDRYRRNRATYRDLVNEECHQLASLAQWECGFRNYREAKRWRELLLKRLEESTDPKFHKDRAEEVEFQELWPTGEKKGELFLEHVEKTHRLFKDLYGEFHSLTLGYALGALEIKGRKRGKVENVPSEYRDFLRSHPKLVCNFVDFDRHRWDASERAQKMDERLLHLGPGTKSLASAKHSI